LLFSSFALTSFRLRPLTPSSFRSLKAQNKACYCRGLLASRVTSLALANQESRDGIYGVQELIGHAEFQVTVNDGQRSRRVNSVRLPGVAQTLALPCAHDEVVCDQFFIFRRILLGRHNKTARTRKIVPNSTRDRPLREFLLRLSSSFTNGISRFSWSVLPAHRGTPMANAFSFDIMSFHPIRNAPVLAVTNPITVRDASRADNGVVNRLGFTSLQNLGFPLVGRS
jgi:hypothetical protein